MTHKWNNPIEWFESYVDALPDDARWRTMLVEFAAELGSDAIQDRFQSEMNEDGYFGNPDGDVECPFCGCITTECPECGILDDHGRVSHCQEKECLEVNAPMQCVRCGRVVSDSLDGVLDFDMSLRRYTG